MRRIKVYVASKLKYAGLWQELDQDAEWQEVMEITSRWPFCHVGNIPDHEAYAGVFWEQDLEDVTKAEVVMLYAEPEDKLRGALVEAGMALALGKRVIVIGTHYDYGTWQYHPQVSRVEGFEEAKTLLRCIGVER